MGTSEGLSPSTPTEQSPDMPTTAQTEVFLRPQDTVISFETARGSVYTYNEAGQTTRFKTSTGEQMAPQDITVFAELTPEKQGDFIFALHGESLTEETKVYIVERQADDSPKKIRTIGDVSKPDKIYLAIFKGDRMVKATPASLYPTVGSNTFDTRYFKKDGVWYSERHLGNKVTKISYKDGLTPPS